MTEYTSMSNQELEALSKQLEEQENEIMKELLNRNWGRNLPDTIEDSDIKVTEDDF